MSTNPLAAPAGAQLPAASIPTSVTICETTALFITQTDCLGVELLIDPHRYVFVRHGCLHLFFEHTGSGSSVLVFDGYSFDSLFRVIENLYYQDKNITQARLRLRVARQPGTPLPAPPLYIHVTLVE